MGVRRRLIERGGEALMFMIARLVFNDHEQIQLAWEGR